MLTIIFQLFLTGKKATRLAGDVARYDVFLSYRVASDLPHARMLYRWLTARGVKVWWDVKCLKGGEQWEDGFCNGLVRSMIFLPIISRGAVNHPSSPRQSFGTLVSDSPCDNVFLEHRLALELRERGLIEKIFPLFFGDQNSEGTYSKYTFSGDYPCHPICSETIIESVECKVRTNLDKQGQGMPFFESQTVQEVMTEITCYQGAFIEGDLVTSMGAAVEMVMDMLVRESSPRHNPYKAGSSFRSDFIPENSPMSPPKCAKVPYPVSPVSPSLTVTNQYTGQNNGQINGQFTGNSNGQFQGQSERSSILFPVSTVPSHSHSLHSTVQFNLPNLPVTLQLSRPPSEISIDLDLL